MTCCTYECTGANGCPVRETPAGICQQSPEIRKYVPGPAEESDPEAKHLWQISLACLIGIVIGLVVPAIFRVGV